MEKFGPAASMHRSALHQSLLLVCAGASVQSGPCAPLSLSSPLLTMALCCYARNDVQDFNQQPDEAAAQPEAHPHVIDSILQVSIERQWVWRPIS